MCMMDFVSLVNQAVSATIALIFPIWVAETSFQTVFIVLGLLTIIYFLVVTFWLPETKGKTLEEVSKYFE